MKEGCQTWSEKFSVFLPKDKKLKSLYQEAKTGDLNGFYGYDIYYNKTNGELIVVVMAGTRENFLAAISLLSFLVLSRVVHFNFFKCFFYFS